jgi:hypothetical protein
MAPKRANVVHYLQPLTTSLPRSPVSIVAETDLPCTRPGQGLDMSRARSLDTCRLIARMPDIHCHSTLEPRQTREKIDKEPSKSLSLWIPRLDLVKNSITQTDYL